MKRLLIEYQVFLSHMHEIEVFITDIDKRSVVDDIAASMPSLNKETTEYLNFVRTLGNSPLAYNAIIISLYGCLENYIDNLLGAYLEILSESRASYEELPEKLREKYRNKFGEFLSNPQRFNNMDLDFSKEISKYHELLQSNLSGTISKSIALYHSGNLCFEEICHLMKALGIKDAKDQIINLHIFKKHHLDNGMDAVEFDTKRSRKTDDFFVPIEQLIMQRNSVAHSWHVEDRIDFHDVKNITIPFVKMLCDCILRICISEAFMLKTDCSVFDNDEPITVIDNRILCMNNQNVKIAVGDYIIYTSNGNVKVANIKNIQIEKVDVPIVNETETKDVGLEIDNTIKAEDKIKLVINAM